MDEMLPNLLLLRHGESQRTYDDDGRLVEGLTQPSLQHASAIGDVLAGWRQLSDFVIYASPWPRARDTAVAISKPIRAPVYVDADLQALQLRIDAGDSSIRDVRQRAWLNPTEQACRGGETVMALQRRCISALRGSMQANPGATVVMVTHTDVIRVLQHALANADASLRAILADGPASDVRHGEVQQWRVERRQERLIGQRIVSSRFPADLETPHGGSSVVQGADDAS